MFKNRLQEIIAERRAARKQDDTPAEQGTDESAPTTRTRGEIRRDAKEEKKEEKNRKIYKKNSKNV